MTTADLTSIDTWVEQNAEKTADIANQIWDLSEMRFIEFKSSEILQNYLSDHGFTIETGIAGMKTAFRASWTNGEGPTIGFLGEFDALAGVSQKAGLDHPEPRDEVQSGHACGHNQLGSASATAAIAATKAMQESGLTGTIEFYACPAEEGGSGKTFMAREGVFANTDVFLTWHPMSITTAWTSPTTANVQATFRFHGTAAHAAQSPWLGRSALDAVELMNVGVNYLREHIVPDARVHYAVTNTGGKSPNVVQANAEVLYLVRAGKVETANEIYERVQNIAKGAALMTGTEVEVIFEKACSEYMPNPTITQVVADELEKVGAPVWNEEEKDLAARIKANYGEGEISQHIKQALDFTGGEDPNGMIAEDTAANVLSEIVLPYTGKGKIIGGSTDVGDVSKNAPTAQLTVTGMPVGTGMHSWQVVSVGRTSMAHKGAKVASKVMGRTALRLLQEPELVAQAKKEYNDAMGGKAYECPIPEGIEPKPFEG